MPGRTGDRDSKWVVPGAGVVVAETEGRGACCPGTTTGVAVEETGALLATAAPSPAAVACLEEGPTTGVAVTGGSEAGGGVDEALLNS